MLLVSAVQRSESSICIRISPPSWTSPIPPSRSSQGPELSSLCFIAGSHYLSVSHMVVYICQSQSPSSSHPPLPPRPSPHIRSLRLYSCPANRFICTIFLDSTINAYIVKKFLRGDQDDGIGRYWTQLLPRTHPNYNKLHRNYF